MAKHSQKFQNSKFAMYLQYLEKEVRDEVHFLHASNILQVGIIDFDGSGQASPQSTQNRKLIFFSIT